jgi:hypothetical protein
MIVTTLNMTTLDGNVVIKKGGGGGNSGGGGTDMPVIGDGKTYLYIEINPIQSQKNVRLYLGQSHEYATTIDWGDGSEIENIQKTSFLITHLYNKGGKYTISIDVKDGCSLTLGQSYNSMFGGGSAVSTGDLMLVAAEFGKNVTFTSMSCNNAQNLKSIIYNDDIKTIKGFGGCTGLRNVTFGSAVSSVGGFNNSSNLFSLDFSRALIVPTLSESKAIPTSQYEVMSIIVPDALYDEWIVATNWSTHASAIIKKSVWDALQ